MKSITAQLVRGRGVSSHGIGYWGAGYYSHIDVVTPLGYLRGARSDVIKGIPAGVEDRPQRYERWERCTRYTFQVTDAQYLAYWSYSDKQLHKPYDTHGLIATFVFGRTWREDDSWWCSELFAMTSEQAGIIKIPKEVRSVTPGDCAFILAGLQALQQEMPV